MSSPSALIKVNYLVIRLLHFGSVLGDLQEGNGCASRCQLPLSLVPIPVFPSTKLAFLCAFASKFFPMVVRRGSMLVVSSRWRPLMMTLAHSPAYRRSDQQYLCRGAQKCHKASSGRACWQRLTKTRTKKPCKRSRTQKSRVQEAAHKEAVYKKSGTKKPCTKKTVHGEECARDGNRTRTDISAHRILSPACLPIPPLEQCKFRLEGQRYYFLSSYEPFLIYFCNLV